MGKLSRPFLPEVLPRRRLFASLDKLQQHPLIWVFGPGRCGKTTLVGSYLQERKISCLWYQVDEGDKDPATFFYYLGQAAQKAFPRRKARLPLFTPEYSRGLAAFTLTYFEKLFSWVKTPSVLVFDNFQEAPEESPLSEILLHALSRTPEGVNFLVLRRKDPPDFLIRLQANQQMGILEWNDLRLSFGETEGIVRLHDPGL